MIYAQRGNIPFPIYRCKAYKFMDNLIKILFTVLVLLIFLSIYDRKNEPKNLEFNNDGKITNLSSNNEAGEILRTGLEVLGADSIEVTLVDINFNVRRTAENETVIEEAFIVNPREDKFTIFINPYYDTSTTIEILSHELIHLCQYKEGRLKLLGGGLVMFEGDTLNIRRTPYLARPWEKEAFYHQTGLSIKIRKHLKK